MINLLTYFARAEEGGGGAAPVAAAPAAAIENCALEGGNFLSFPTWYRYLEGVTDKASGLCSPQLSGITDIWLILAAILEILLRVAALAAVFAVIFGGFTYLTSQGEPEKTTKARMTIIGGVGGLLIALMASIIIGFVAGSIK